ncbi:hypothetical protein C9374_010855 [Naegleria lovaniensis]|uniref:UBZ4-type domain-containing protein n=1 Tax=Naegleria lovaniensis TaxID=51637 RepID=A0AA88KCZ4_NAELO|nr:uncharacterized protein C9374_010855 [Naegleria lovaniensis]KAG2374285.1 hypothetical protein C9374_010855 [Naegleria lovaniensis]
MEQNRRTRSSPLSKLNSLLNNLYSRHSKLVIHNVLKASDMEQFKNVERKLKDCLYETRQQFLVELEKAFDSVPIHHQTTITVVNSKKKTSKLKESFDSDEVLGKINDDLQMMDKYVRSLEESISSLKQSQEDNEIGIRDLRIDPNKDHNEIITTPNNESISASKKRKKKSKKPKTMSNKKKKTIQVREPESSKDSERAKVETQDEQSAMEQTNTLDDMVQRNQAVSSSSRRRISFSSSVVFYEDLVECPLCQRKFTKYQIKIHMDKIHYDKDKTLNKKKAKLTKTIIAQVKESEMKKKLFGILNK